MEVKWLRKALHNLDREAEYIAAEDPVAARDLARKIDSLISLLADNPALGHPGRLPGTRELVIPGTRYVIPYRVNPRKQRVEILRFFHMARKTPKHWQGGHRPPSRRKSQQSGGRCPSYGQASGPYPENPPST